MGNNKNGVDYNLIIQAIKWITRIAGSLLVLLVLIIAIGSFASEGVPSSLDGTPYTLTIADIIMFVAMFLMTSGLVIGWFKELIASILVVSGYLLFSITNLISTGNFLTGEVTFTFLIVGILYFVIWMLEKKYKKEA
jgi:hypothetical protein